MLKVDLKIKNLYFNLIFFTYILFNNDIKEIIANVSYNYNFVNNI